MSVALAVCIAMFLVPPIAIGLMGHCYVNDVPVETTLFWPLVFMMVAGAGGLIGFGAIGLGHLILALL